MVLPPIAGETAIRIVTPLFFEEVDHPGMSFEDLVLPGPAMVGEIIGSSKPGGEVDQSSEGGSGPGDAIFIVISMQVENHARAVFLGPGEEAFIILLN